MNGQLHTTKSRQDGWRANIAVRPVVWQVLVLCALVVLVFIPVTQFGFFWIDDGVMVYENTRIINLSWDNVTYWFTKIHAGLYHPLVHLSYALEIHLFAMDPAVMHTTNLFLHLLNTLLVYWLIRRLSGHAVPGLIAALLFGIHPVQVEPVAWISARKDTLCAVFYLAGLWSYTRFLQEGRQRFYVLTAVLFVGSLLSKPMAISFPLVMVLLCHMVEGRCTVRRLMGLTPFLLLAGVGGAVAVYGQESLQVQTFSWYAIAQKLLDANYKLVLYVYNLAFPAYLSFIYPSYMENEALMRNYFWYSPAITAVFGAVVIYSLRYSRALCYGALFFLITVLPTLGIISFGVSLPNDRYLYMPSIGLFYSVAVLFWWGYSSSSRRQRAVLGLLATMVVVSLGIVARQRVLVWRNPTDVMNTAITRYGYSHNSALAHQALAWECMNQHKLAAAQQHLDALQALDSPLVHGREELGLWHELSGNDSAARENYMAAVQYKPNVARYRRVLYEHLYRREQYNDVIAGCTEFLNEIRPHAALFCLRGRALLRRGDILAAIEDFTRALQQDPNSSDAYLYRSEAYRLQGDMVRARQDYTTAARLAARSVVGTFSTQR
jgi:Tfp pilus assembly protein PilF